jgi:hypothetical protein
LTAAPAKRYKNEMKEDAISGSKHYSRKIPLPRQQQQQQALSVLKLQLNSN